MTPTGGKTPKQDQLRRLEDVLIEGILDASPEQLREEVRADGLDPDALVAIARSKIEEAKGEAARMRLEEAKKKATAFREAKGRVVSLDRAKARLEAARSGQDTEMMLAARKGQGMSENDENALLEAMAELERLESEDREE